MGETAIETICERIEPRANLAGAKLAGAKLAGANLEGADLAGADLYRADLTRANLAGANLTEADLAGADLTEADLTEADLTRANLTGADLYGADLTRANLAGADLTRAKLTRAKLTGTCLDPSAECPPITDEEILAAGLEIDGDWIVGWRTARSAHCGDTEYVPGRAYDAPVFSVDGSTECHPGRHFASRGWLRAAYPSDDYVRCRARRRDTVHAGEKWRTRRLEILSRQSATAWGMVDGGWRL